jgi:hypothetical protein
MLKQLNDDQRFQLVRKLCMDVLSSYVDGAIPLSDVRGARVLVDTLAILQSKVHLHARLTYERISKCRLNPSRRLMMMMK